MTTLKSKMFKKIQFNSASRIIPNITDLAHLNFPLSLWHKILTIPMPRSCQSLLMKTYNFDRSENKIHSFSSPVFTSIFSVESFDWKPCSNSNREDPDGASTLSVAVLFELLKPQKALVFLITDVFLLLTGWSSISSEVCKFSIVTSCENSKRLKMQSTLVCFEWKTFKFEKKWFVERTCLLEFWSTLKNNCRNYSDFKHSVFRWYDWSWLNLSV